MPRGSEIYATKVPPPHPFATMFPHTPDECIPELLSCLRLEEARDELFQDLDSFEKRVHICAFPYVPLEITKSEVERFLADPIKNAQMCPEMLGLLFAALALGSQYSAWDKSGGKWRADMTGRELRKGDVYSQFLCSWRLSILTFHKVAAAMQALRLASFLHKPTLLGIQTLIMMGPFLTNSGRFLDAWTLFGTTIRLAHSMGLHRHPKYLDPSPPTQRECSIRQTLWWWMLHMDQEYSMTLGRPLGISGIGDCPPPHELTTDPRMLRFGEFVNHFTVMARQILSSDCLTNAKIDEFTDHLKGLLETMPEMLQFDPSWLDETKEIPEWPLGTMAAGKSPDLAWASGHEKLTNAVFYCKTHTYLILLNRQRIEKQHSTRGASSYFGATSSQPTTSASSPASPQPSLRGRAQVLSSSSDLLTAFLFFHARVPAALICWTIGQQAFNSCMILLLDAMETGDLAHIRQVERAYVVFVQLQNNGVHELATLAVERVSWGLAQLGRLKGYKNHGDDQSFEMPGLSGAGSRIAGTFNAAMQGTTTATAESEASTVHENLLRDTVMGNTGMLLLEDPGLQSFTPEAFQPFNWNVGKENLSGNQEYVDPSGKKEEVEKRQGEGAGYARSSEQLQGTTGSEPGSAPRFATFDTAPAREQLEHQTSQPQGPTSSTSPHLRLSGSSAGGLPSPHLRHHSYPFSRQVPSSRRRVQHRRTHGKNSDSRAGDASDDSRDMGGQPDAHPQSGPSQPHFHALPDYMTLSTPATNPNVHPSWAARPAVLMSNASDSLIMDGEPSPSFAAPPFSSRDMPTHAWQYRVPYHIPSSGGDNIVAPVHDDNATHVRREDEQWGE